VRLRDRDGLDDRQLAEELRLTVAQVRRLFEEADQLLDLEQYKRDSIPVAPIRELYEQRLANEPALTPTIVAQKAGLDRVALRRALGLAPTASRARAGKRTPGRLRSEITVEMAGRIVKAIDVAPHEVPWL
jgi:hypothetical protein